MVVMIKETSRTIPIRLRRKNSIIIFITNREDKIVKTFILAGGLVYVYASYTYPF